MSLVGGDVNDILMEVLEIVPGTVHGSCLLLSRLALISGHSLPYSVYRHIGSELYAGEANYFLSD